MDVSAPTTIQNKLISALINKDKESFSKCLTESVEYVEQSLVEKYSERIKEKLNV